MSEANRSIFQHFLDEVVERGSLSVIEDVISPQFLNHDPRLPHLPPDLEGEKRFFAELHTSFEGLEVHVQELRAFQEVVVCRSTWSGMHVGSFAGLPCARRRVSLEVVDILKFRNGFLMERWGLLDHWHLLNQLKGDQT